MNGKSVEERFMKVNSTDDTSRMKRKGDNAPFYRRQSAGAPCMRGKSATGAPYMKGNSTDTTLLRINSASPPRGGKRARGKFELNVIYPGKL